MRNERGERRENALSLFIQYIVTIKHNIANISMTIILFHLWLAPHWRANTYTYIALQIHALQTGD